MAKVQPWYKVVTPRADLREGKPLDASEFAVHLDHVREGRASEDYQNAARFFDRTFLTKTLLDLAGEVTRRLSGERTETSAVFNMTTQFGGGKTHALTLLYHLAMNGAQAGKWTGVPRIIEKAGVKQIPLAAAAVFVGTEFDSIRGRGGDDGTPKRNTPWGEIAFQLNGVEGFKEVAEHEQRMEAPGGDVVRKFLPKNKPCLILIDELLNYINRNRNSGLASQLYNFLHTLTGVLKGIEGVVLVVSLPASELEMTPEDHADFERFKKMLDRDGKAMIMSAEGETSEIIRRRLFEWDPRAVNSEGKVLLPRDAVAACGEYAEWLNDNRAQIPEWFSVDHAKSTLEASYPFHPMVLSVFERKWQELPRFQRTRGILRLLALWISHAYQKGFKGADGDYLIELGSAPLEDSLFRTAVLEQLGEMTLEGAVTTDICGKKDSHAVRLDEEAVETLKKAHLHKKVAATIFFESNGGQAKNEATLAEVRLAVAGPEMDLGNVETALEALTDACYYLTSERNRYRFSLKENLNKRFADRRVSMKGEDIEKRVKEEIQKVFPSTDGVERIFFPDKSAQVPDRPAITLIVMAPEQSVQDDPEIQTKIDAMTREHGKSARTYKSALLWVVPEAAGSMREEARKLLAWEDIENDNLNLDEAQRKQLDTSIKKARRDLNESVWRTYKNVMLLSKENTLEPEDLGLVTSSSAESLPKLILNFLRQKDKVEKEVSPRFLVGHWPPAFTEWSTKSVRDAFYASPQFPRLLNSETIKDTIARGVAEGAIAYVGKALTGGYSPFLFKKSLPSADVEISDDTYIIKAEEALKHIEPPKLVQLLVSPSMVQLQPGIKQTFAVKGLDQFGRDMNLVGIKWRATGGQIDKDGVFTPGTDEGSFLVTAEADGKAGSAGVTVSKESKPPSPEPKPHGASKLKWVGEVAPQKWTNLYMKVLSKLVSAGDVKLRVEIEASPKDGVTDQQIEETKAALRGLGLDDDVKKE